MTPREARKAAGGSPVEAATDPAGGVPLYPLLFAPILQYRLWGGRQLAELLSAPPGVDGPIGEAWLLSDRPDHQSRVVAGPLAGQSLGALLEEYPEQMLGELAGRFRRFPVLLKLLDAHELLSVQVHPSDEQTDHLPAGETGKTEAWVVLESGPESRIYAGLRPGTTAGNLRSALATGAIAGQLVGFTPKPGDALFLPAGTVHSLGGDLVVLEVQENSDVTFRLHDWDRVDPATGLQRALQVDEALDCIDLAQGVLRPVLPVLEAGARVRRERLFDCRQFRLWRIEGELPFTVGAADLPRVLVCIAGSGDVLHGGASHPIEFGDVMLLPAMVGECTVRPRGLLSVVEVALPDAPTISVVDGPPCSAVRLGGAAPEA
ncbi:MAG: type I phosphomannose isomerase catalytic subunit [Candidatus Dormibacteria bacterium]